MLSRVRESPFFSALMRIFEAVTVPFLLTILALAASIPLSAALGRMDEMESDSLGLVALATAFVVATLG